MNKKVKEFYSTEAALIERENEVLAELETEYGLEDLRPTDTEPNLLGRIKNDLKVYSRMRSDLRCKADLLETLHTELCKYRVLVPEFYGGPLLCIEHLRNAVAALRDPKKPGCKDGSQAGVPKSVWKIYGGLF